MNDDGSDKGSGPGHDRKAEKLASQCVFLCSSLKAVDLCMSCVFRASAAFLLAVNIGRTFHQVNFFPYILAHELNIEPLETVTTHEINGYLSSNCAIFYNINS